MVGENFPSSFVASYAEKVGFLPSDSVISSDVFKISSDIFKISSDVFEISREIIGAMSDVFCLEIGRFRSFMADIYKNGRISCEKCKFM